MEKVLSSTSSASKWKGREVHLAVWLQVLASNTIYTAPVWGHFYVLFSHKSFVHFSSLYCILILCLTPAFTVYTVAELLLAEHSFPYFNYFKICLKIDLWFWKSFGSIRKTPAQNMVWIIWTHTHMHTHSGEHRTSTYPNGRIKGKKLKDGVTYISQ